MTNTLTQVATMGWPWKSEDPAIHIILVSDQQFTNLADHPDEALERVFPQDPEPISLREHCKRGAERGATKLLLAYDYFFGGSKRSLYPDTPAFQDNLKKVADVAREFGLSLEPSILSPLELGIGFKARTGESGRWMHYREGLRDVHSGAYSINMWQHLRWCNNKGPTPLRMIGARAFAFREEPIAGTSYHAVDPSAIVELPAPEIEPMPGTNPHTGALSGGASANVANFDAIHVRVHGKGGPDGLDRVLVVLQYETVEMDYFSPDAPEYLRDLVQQYHERDIALAGVYSDEMHIQQDWSYHTHFDHGQFNMRYVSRSFEKAFAREFGEQYADFARFLVYFTCHQHEFLPTHEPKLPNQHVMGKTTADIVATMQLRANYYHFLESSVVNLMNGARKQLEELIGHSLDNYYHSTWAESPTCDAWAAGGVHDSWSVGEHRSRYEYTPDFVWSNTVHQAAAACANYFLWNEYLTGGNNDVPEGGYADRNYYGRALACSLAALNRSPLASAGMWGMPPEVNNRMMAVSEVYGALGHPVFRAVQDYQGRSSDVLFLYPQDLVAVEERFGSWMTLYGYANYITAEKLVEYGRITNTGKLEVKGEQYRAVCALYEPFPSAALLNLLEKFTQQGGIVVWSSVPPLPSQIDQIDTQKWMESVFGAQVLPTTDPLGLPLPSRNVRFSATLSAVPAQTILTDFIVDRVFAVEAVAGAEQVAWINTGGPQHTICAGTLKTHPSGGKALYLGFRPRDDQAASTGDESRTWFEVLRALSAYPTADNPSVISRTGNLLACVFPNSTIAVCPHFKDTPENWQGGFFRDPTEDARVMAEHPLADDHFTLDQKRIQGQTISYQGRHAVTWRLDAHGHLFAFAGYDTMGITINGQAYQWSDVPVDIGWHPLSTAHATAEFSTRYRIWCNTNATIRIPLSVMDTGAQLWVGAHAPWGNTASGPAYGRAGYASRQIPCRWQDGNLILTIDADTVAHWLYVVVPRG